MALWLTFRGSPCPNLWNCISESGTDLANMLIQNKFWDHRKFYDNLSTLIEEPKSLPDSIEFAQAKKLAVQIPVKNVGKADIHINDTIGIALNKDDNVNRVCKAIPLAIHTMSRPLDSSDEIPRKEIIISLKKLSAEGTPSEVKIVLGWTINTRNLRIYLPEDKYKTWTQEISIILTTEKVKKNNMETLIGRLNHISLLMEMLIHFMSHLRQALYRATLHKFTFLRIFEKEDLHIMLKFLEIATTKGVSMNNLTYRYPTHIYRSDTSLFGLGGYNILSGQAWRFQLPVNC